MSSIVLLILFYFAICSLCIKIFIAVVFADVTGIGIIDILGANVTLKYTRDCF